MRKSFLLFLLCALATGAAAQTPQHYNYNSAGVSNSLPFNNSSGYRCQWLVGPGEFNQPRPAPPGDITRLYIYMSAPAATATYSQLTIKMGQTTLTSLPAGVAYPGGLETVYFSPSVALSSVPNTWLAMTLTKPFHYNPDLSLVIEISQCGFTGTGMWIFQTVGTTGIIRRNYIPGTTSCVFTYSGQDTRILQCGIDITPGVSRQAVGKFYGVAKDAVAVDFGAAGVWMYYNGSWTQLTTNDSESLTAADVDGDNLDEIIADFGSLGLWLWNGGAWNPLSALNVESLAAGDVDADGINEVIGDFGAVGLWLLNGGAWTQLSGANADAVTTVKFNAAGPAIVAGDFGTAGLWFWSTGTWFQMSGVNPDTLATGKLNTGGGLLVIDFGPAGLWWDTLGGGAQLSGANADDVIAADTDGDSTDEIVGDFGATGVWLYDNASWTGLSSANAHALVRAEVNGDGKDELAVSFGSMGLWLWNAGVWTQLSGVFAEYLAAADVDGDAKKEILSDFGTLGLWMWNEGSWSQISGSNPD